MNWTDAAVYAGGGGVSYLIGSIPFGYLVARAVRGIDIREHGSGSIGATNVARALGPVYFFPVFLLDVLKGFAPVFFLAPLAVRTWMGASPFHVSMMSITCGSMALVGHMWPVTLGFRGGKGVATGAGVGLALSPIATGVTLGVWLILFLLTRFVSLASIVAAPALPAAYVLLAKRDSASSDPVFFFFIGIALLVIMAHRSNIQRLLHGSEPRVSWPRQTR